VDNIEMGLKERWRESVSCTSVGPIVIGVRACECGDEPWDSIKGGALIDNTNGCQLIKYYFVLPRHVFTRVINVV
jgi:hypothetical protein